MADWYMKKDGIEVKIQGAVVTITIDLPETKNGLNWRAMEALAEAYDRIAADRDARVIVQTGTGKYFYTGGRVDANDPEDRARYAASIAHMSSQSKKLKLPVIAAINGDCLKGGMGWLVGADMAIAKRTAQFGFPELRMGGVPMLVMAQCMCLPKKFALEAYYSSENFDAETMYRFGLLNAITDEDDFWPTVEKYIHIIIDNPQVLIQMTHDAYFAMEELATTAERTSFAQKMLEEKVLPQMANEKQEYNV